MRRHLSVTLISLLLGMIAHAQLPKWVILPDYDKLSVKVDDCLLQTDSAGVTALWSLDGKCLFKTEHRIHPFREGVAVITKKGSDVLVGIVDTSGKFVALPEIKHAFGRPFFENGHIICHVPDGYAYYKKDGSRAMVPAALRSYPFHGGYAPFFSYAQPEKMKDPYYGYYRADGGEMNYRLIDKGVAKEFDPKMISFLSGIGNNNKGVAVIKNKLFLFDPATDLFEPFLYGDDPSEKKRHLSLTGDYELYFANLPSDTVELTAKYGKNQMATLLFDNELRPVKFVFDGEEVSFPAPAAQEYTYTSDIKPYAEGGKYGLASMGRRILPAQFDEVGLRYGNRCFVKSNGKWGIVEIIPDLDYSLKLNKAQDVAFRHQTFDTQIRLDLPAAISAKDARIDLPASSGCVIDKTSRVTKDTESGNFVIYDCVLNIPEAMPDTMTRITYAPVNVSYDGFSLFDRSIGINAWHVKYYNVDPIESETSISDGVTSFTININTQKNAGESDYPFEVKIEADSVTVELEKISETRYKCLVSNLQEGDNNLNIIVTEKGCPPSVFPFEVNYTKPVKKDKKNKETKETVVVRKKTPRATKPAVKPAEKPAVRIDMGL